MQRQAEIGKKNKQMLSNTLRFNFLLLFENLKFVTFFIYVIIQKYMDVF